MQRPSQQGLVDAWNANHGIGTRVIVTLDSGESRETRTRTAADLLGGHTAVIWLEGISGCYALERVRAAVMEPEGPVAGHRSLT